MIEPTFFVIFPTIRTSLVSSSCFSFWQSRYTVQSLNFSSTAPKAVTSERAIRELARAISLRVKVLDPMLAYNTLYIRDFNSRELASAERIWVSRTEAQRTPTEGW